MIATSQLHTKQANYMEKKGKELRNKEEIQEWKIKERKNKRKSECKRNAVNQT